MPTKQSNKAYSAHGSQLLQGTLDAFSPIISRMIITPEPEEDDKRRALKALSGREMCGHLSRLGVKMINGKEAPRITGKTVQDLEDKIVKEKIQVIDTERAFGNAFKTSDIDFKSAGLLYTSYHILNHWLASSKGKVMPPLQEPQKIENPEIHPFLLLEIIKAFNQECITGAVGSLICEITMPLASIDTDDPAKITSLPYMEIEPYSYSHVGLIYTLSHNVSSLQTENIPSHIAARLHIDVELEGDSVVYKPRAHLYFSKVLLDGLGNQNLTATDDLYASRTYKTFRVSHKRIENDMCFAVLPESMFVPLKEIRHKVKGTSTPSGNKVAIEEEHSLLPPQYAIEVEEDFKNIIFPPGEHIKDDKLLRSSLHKCAFEAQELYNIQAAGVTPTDFTLPKEKVISHEISPKSSEKTDKQQSPAPTGEVESLKKTTDSTDSSVQTDSEVTRADKQQSPAPTGEVESLKKTTDSTDSSVQTDSEVTEDAEQSPKVTVRKKFFYPPVTGNLPESIPGLSAVERRSDLAYLVVEGGAESVKVNITRVKDPIHSQELQQFTLRSDPSDLQELSEGLQHFIYTKFKERRASFLQLSKTANTLKDLLDHHVFVNGVQLSTQDISHKLEPYPVEELCQLHGLTASKDFYLTPNETSAVSRHTFQVIHDLVKVNQPPTASIHPALIEELSSTLNQDFLLSILTKALQDTDATHNRTPILNTSTIGELIPISTTVNTFYTAPDLLKVVIRSENHISSLPGEKIGTYLSYNLIICPERPPKFRMRQEYNKITYSDIKAAFWIPEKSLSPDLNIVPADYTTPEELPLWRRILRWVINAFRFLFGACARCFGCKKPTASARDVDPAAVEEVEDFAEESTEIQTRAPIAVGGERIPHIANAKQEQQASATAGPSVESSTSSTISNYLEDVSVEEKFTGASQEKECKPRGKTM